MDETSNSVYGSAYAYSTLAGVCVYIITCEKHRVAFVRVPPMSILSRVSYRIFAPSRARRLAGLKRRRANNKPRNSCPANATGRYFTRRIEVKCLIRVDDTKVNHAHVKESCNALIHPAIFFSCNLFQLSLLAFAARENIKYRTFEVLTSILYEI